MTQHLEVRTITTHDIGVTIMIDYDRGTVSLVEQDPINSASLWRGKKYLFTNRELNYMNGWLNILDAMMAAVEEGKRLLEKDLAIRSAFSTSLVIDVFKKEKIANVVASKTAKRKKTK